MKIKITTLILEKDTMHEIQVTNLVVLLSFFALFTAIINAHYGGNYDTFSSF